MTNPQLSKLQSEVDRICAKYINRQQYAGTVNRVRFMLGNDIEQLIATQRTSIIEELRSVLPKKNHITKLSGNSRFDQQVSNEIDGFNEAIDLITETYRQKTEDLIKSLS